MPMTKLANLVDPEVMADMVSATLPKKIKFTPIAHIDTTLVGQPGDTITVPKYAYIGDAEDIAEGVAMGTTVLTASTTKANYKVAAHPLDGMQSLRIAVKLIAQSVVEDMEQETDNTTEEPKTDPGSDLEDW